MIPKSKQCLAKKISGDDLVAIEAKYHFLACQNIEIDIAPTFVRKGKRWILIMKEYKQEHLLKWCLMLRQLLRVNCTCSKSKNFVVCVKNG